MQQKNLIPTHINTLGKAEHFLTSTLPNLARQPYDAESAFKHSQEFFSAFNNPQNAKNVIHVAGTSGKGTVCYLIDAMLRAHDKRSGLIISPHVYDIRERIQFDGQLISERMFLETLNKVLPYITSQVAKGNPPHYPETLQLIGFLASTRVRLDYLVVETGMGGRLDATNTITKSGKYCVLTQIGLDHIEQLGTTYGQIAAEKVAIVKDQCWVSALRQKESVNEVFQETFNRNHNHTTWIESTGDYVTDNLLLALNCVKDLADRDGWQFDEELAKKSVINLYIPGRFEKRTFKNNLVILDGAHNPQKLSALVSRLEREELAPATIVLALGQHKDYINSLKALLPVAKRLLICEFFLEKPTIPRRPFAADMLKSAALEIDFQEVEVIKSPVLCMQKASSFEEPILVTGSFYLLGEIDKVF